MSGGKILSLKWGEWLLNRRWWLVALASLAVFLFEFVEYMPFQHGIKLNFFFEILFYAVFLPLSTGLSLSALAASRSELAWSIYYQNLKHNLEIQLSDAHSPDELADVFLQFVRVVVPLVGALVYQYDPRTSSYKTLLSWSLSKDLKSSDTLFDCGAAGGCGLRAGHEEKEKNILYPCQAPDGSTSENAHCYCLPLWFSTSTVVGARLCFQPDHEPSAEQIRLLKEVTPELASAFHRTELEYLMKKRADSLTEEQRRIARDVHDSLGHSLAYMRLRLDQISMEFNQTATDILRNEVENLRDLAKEAYDQMRDILVVLSPENHSNLHGSLLQYLEIVRQRSSYDFRIQSRGQPRGFSPLVQRHIFFIFREALANVEKHAHAREVCVQLNWEESGLKIDIHDDGAGFDPLLATQNGHFGLKNMQERATEIGGQLCISSQLGRGTNFVLQVPYQDEL